MQLFEFLWTHNVRLTCPALFAGSECSRLLGEKILEVSIMFFMTKKKRIEIAEFLGRYSLVFDNANGCQQSALLAQASTEQISLLNAFFSAREGLRLRLPDKNSHDSSCRADNGSNG